MRWVIILLAGMVLGLLYGGQGAYVWMTNREPTAMSVADYLKSKPSATWVKLTDAWLDYTDAMVYTETKKKSGREEVKAIYVPVLTKPGAERAYRLLLKLEPSKGALVDTSAYRQLAAFKLLTPGVLAGMDLPDKLPTLTREQALAELTPNDTIQGMVQFGWTDSQKVRDAMRESLAGQNVRDITIIDADEKPTLGLPVAALAVGLLCAAALARKVFGRRTPVPASPPANTFQEQLAQRDQRP